MNLKAHRRAGVLVSTAIVALICATRPAGTEDEPAWLRMDHRELVSLVVAECHREGMRAIPNGEHISRIDWLLARELDAWDSVHNAAYERLEFQQESNGPEPRRDTLSFFRVEAAFDPATNKATRMASLGLIPYYRSSGWPRPGQSALGVVSAFDGRRLMSVQFPPPRIARPHAERSNEWSINDQTLKPIGPAGEAGAHLPAERALPYRLGAKDILLTFFLLDETSEQYAEWMRDGGMTNAAHPFIKFYVESTPFLRRVRNSLSSSHSNVIIELLESPDSISIIVSDADESPVRYQHFRFERESGLLIEATAIGLDSSTGTIRGLSLFWTLADVHTEEGERLRLPISRIEIDSPPDWVVERLDRGREAVAISGRERAVFVHFDRVNGSDLNQPAFFGLDQIMERVGLRVAFDPMNSKDGRGRFRPGAPVFGPGENDLEFAAKWDEYLHLALMRAGVPFDVAQLLPFAEIVGRPSDRPEHWFSYRMADDGSVERLRPDGRPITRVVVD